MHRTTKQAMFLEKIPETSEKMASPTTCNAASDFTEKIDDVRENNEATEASSAASRPEAAALDAAAKSPISEKGQSTPEKDVEAKNTEKSSVKEEILEEKVIIPKCKTEVEVENEPSPQPQKPPKKTSAPKVTMVEVLASKHLSDASKFHVFKELVQDGHMSNKEVVNTVLYLVSFFGFLLQNHQKVLEIATILANGNGNSE